MVTICEKRTCWLDPFRRVGPQVRALESPVLQDVTSRVTPSCSSTGERLQSVHLLKPGNHISALQPFLKIGRTAGFPGLLIPKCKAAGEHLTVVFVPNGMQDRIPEVMLTMPTSRERSWHLQQAFALTDVTVERLPEGQCCYNTGAILRHLKGWRERIYMGGLDPTYVALLLGIRRKKGQLTVYQVTGCPHGDPEEFLDSVMFSLR